MGKDFEMCVQRVYEAILRENDMAIDAGAHTGRHAIPMARCVGTGGRVFAFEPLPMCREALADQLENEHRSLKDVIHLYRYALSSEAGEGEFVVAKDLLAYSGLRERTYDAPTRLERIPVKIKTVDELFGDFPALRFIKIDAEGGEYPIMKGATACLKQLRPVMTFEFGLNSIAEYDFELADVAEFLASIDYQVLDINGKCLATTAEFVDSSTRQEVWDYIAIPAEQTDIVERVADLLQAIQ